MELILDIVPSYISDNDRKCLKGDFIIQQGSLIKVNPSVLIVFFSVGISQVRRKSSLGISLHGQFPWKRS